MEINKIIEWIDEDIKYQEEQLKGDFHRDMSINWRIAGMKALLRKIHIQLKKNVENLNENEDVKVDVNSTNPADKYRKTHATLSQEELDNLNDQDSTQCKLPLNKTELKDLDYLLEKIEKGEGFYALEISKAKYLLERIKGMKQDVQDTLCECGHSNLSHGTKITNDEIDNHGGNCLVNSPNECKCKNFLQDTQCEDCMVLHSPDCCPLLKKNTKNFNENKDVKVDVNQDKKGCGEFIKNDKGYGWINCGDILENRNEDATKVELCKKCQEDRQDELSWLEGYKDFLVTQSISGDSLTAVQKRIDYLKQDRKNAPGGQK